QVHRDHDRTDHATDDHHYHGLDQARQRVDRVVDFLLVELGDLEQHGVQRTRLLADRGHLYHHVREQVDLLHRDVDGVAHRYVILHAVHGLLIDLVAGGTGHGIQGLDQRNTRLEGHGQGAGKARDRGVMQYLTDDRKFQ